MLYQKGTQRIEVIVRKDATESGAMEKEVSDQKQSVGSNGKKSASDRRRKRIIVTNTTHALSAIKQISSLSLQYYVSGIGIRSGDQAMQDQVGRTLEKITDTTNVASNVARGMVFGAWGGIVGIAVGALTAAATSAASLGVKYGGRGREYNFKIFKENNAIEYNRARSGTNIFNGRLR
jgi:hypothetical protein